MKKKIGVIMMFMVSLMLVGCGGAYPNYGLKDHMYPIPYEENENEEYQEIVENEFLMTETHPLSNMSLSANTASYQQIRRDIINGGSINPNMIRIEEMINYFNFQYETPKDGEIFGVTSSVIQTPWNPETSLLIIGMQAEKIKKENINNNLVFLIDVSGSMYGENRLPLVQQSFNLLLEQLGSNDYISIVTYASGVNTVLKGARGDEKLKISAVINDLQASGSTAGSKGIQRAYEVASEYFIEGGNNRVILATDGDFNVGISSNSALEDFISDKRKTGIYLSVFGFGMGNYKDKKLETLANKGNGNYAYIDNLLEAKKALIEDIGGTLYTVARDAKAQINFASSRVSEYRLIGYENRMLTNEEFDEDETDAGEIGLGHQVTLVYEIKYDFDTDLRGFGSIDIRYKDPDTTKEEVISHIYELNHKIIENNVSEQNMFIASVVEFGLILRDSKFKEQASLDQIILRIENLDIVKNDVFKQEFLSLVKKYRLRD